MTARRDNILNWLKNIVSLYVAPSLDLTYDDQGNVVITCSKYKNTITIQKIEALWEYGRSDLPHTIIGKIPAPGTEKAPRALTTTEKSSGDLTIHYDVMGLTLWMLSRAEEIGRADLDEHERFPARSSHALNNNYLELPIVDLWMGKLGEIVKKHWPDTKLCKHQYQPFVSHDVDTPSRYGFRNLKSFTGLCAREFLQTRSFPQLFTALKIKLNGKDIADNDPDNTFNWLMDLSERHNIKSAFYFICGRTNHHKDALYNPDDPAITQLMKNIYKRGHEIGLHPSYNCFESEENFLKEAQSLKSICKKNKINQSGFGGRMHYLRWRMPNTAHFWAQANMRYDSTLGYADHAGFRCGTCREYPAIDAITGKTIDLIIRPLIAMEVTIINDQYMGLGNGEVAFEKMKELIDKCRSVNGNFTLLWHNSNFKNVSDKDLYERILEYAGAKA